MELIVKCIRTSSSPQTHHHALLLLTVAAKIDPVRHYLCLVVIVFVCIMNGDVLTSENYFADNL